MDERRRRVLFQRKTAMDRRRASIRSSLLFLAIVTLTAAPCAAQGIFVAGVGPVNRSMAGAGAAAPLDAIGALYRNPGSISGLSCNEVSFGIEALLADIDLSSTVGGITARTSGEPGAAPIPSLGWVHHVDNSNVTIGLGMFGVGGFRNNMPRDTNNPLLATGPMFADAEILQIVPTISWQLSDRLSFGVSPTISAARLMFDPLGPPITGAITPGSGNRVHWGAGVQAGAYYVADNGWRFGATIKSPQWFEEFRFFTQTGVAKFDLDLPLIVSMGAAYSVSENLLIAGDLRYYTFDDADGFDDLGWNNVLAGAIGMQYIARENLILRAGWAVNETAIGGESGFLNIASPLIQRNNLSAGATVLLADNVDLNLAYVYLVNSSVTGPLPSPPFGASDTITHEIDAHSLVMGVTVRY